MEFTCPVSPPRPRRALENPRLGCQRLSAPISAPSPQRTPFSGRFSQIRSPHFSAFRDFTNLLARILRSRSAIARWPTITFKISKVERIVKKSRTFREADRWDVRQNIALTPQERIRIAHALRKRAYPANAKDVRECHRAP